MRPPFPIALAIFINFKISTIMSEIIQIQQAEIVQAQEKAAIDVQIATAKAYPRHLPTVLNRIQTYATMDEETAEDCFYALRRAGAGGQQIIEGLSVRMAEIIASAWGNMRVKTSIIANDGKTITAEGVCLDLETNVAVSVEVKRRITDKQGRTYSEDMQVVTGNAASAIAFRNAVLKVVPKAVVKKVVSEVKQVALGKSLDLETSRQNMLAYFAKLGVTEDMIYIYLGITKREEIDTEMVFELRGVANAIKEGTTSVAETFVKAVEDKKAEDKAKQTASAVKDAMANSTKKSDTAKHVADKPADANTDKPVGEPKPKTAQQAIQDAIKEKTSQVTAKNDGNLFNQQ